MVEFYKVFIEYFFEMCLINIKFVYKFSKNKFVQYTMN